MTGPESSGPQGEQVAVKKVSLTIDDQAIAERARQLWLKDGQIPGNDKWYWFRAKEQLEKELQAEINGVIRAIQHSRKPRDAHGLVFVIQPFDAGPYDKRYIDVFEPAILAAGLEPYRVDRDPAVSVPIDEIENGIRAADICFAEISTNNPNVWFELGYAIASGKEVVLVCSEQRTEKFPFDIQHRNIIRYRTESTSDFVRLGSEVAERLRALAQKPHGTVSEIWLSPSH
jgi:hypothetical protein